jgi:predicted RNase H-like HicB family nuclease
MPVHWSEIVRRTGAIMSKSKSTSIRRKPRPEDRMLYCAVLTPLGDDGFAVAFPDFPDAAPDDVGADTLCEAYGMAEEALAEHVRGLLARGETLPEPTPPDQLPAAPPAGAALFMVPVRLEPRRVVKVTLTMTEQEKDTLDAVAADWNMSRSQVVVAAIRDLCDRMGCP